MATMAALRPVQEILEGGIVPQQYLQQKDHENHQVDNGPLPYMESPLIDFGLLISSNPDELEKLHSSLTSWGCAQVVNHGMLSSSLEEVREISKKFFRLPLEEKEKYASKGNCPEGYGNTNAYVQGIQSFHWNDKLHLQVFPENKRQFEFWPQQNPQNFRTILHEYSVETRRILETLLKAMARSLKLEESRFFELWGDDQDDTVHARFNFYPRCPNSDLVDGLKPHGDGTAITILLQDEDVEGLRILKDNQWFRVPIIPEAIVIIVGDQMEIASNGIYKSPTHKVVVNPQYDRNSLAMLFIPNPEKEIGPLNELINEERPQLYKRLKNYGQIYLQDLPSGERQINVVKIY